MTVFERMPDGSRRPAEPVGWQEEHGRLTRAVLWLRGVEHCNDQEGRRWRTCDFCGRRLSRARRNLRLTVCGGPCYAKRYGDRAASQETASKGGPNDAH